MAEPGAMSWSFDCDFDLAGLPGARTCSTFRDNPDGLGLPEGNRFALAFDLALGLRPVLDSGTDMLSPCTSGVTVT